MVLPINSNYDPCRTMTLVLLLYELHMCFPLISSTFVCVVVHAIEKGYPIYLIFEHSMSNLKPTHTLSPLLHCTQPHLLLMYPTRPEKQPCCMALSHGRASCGMYVNHISMVSSLGHKRKKVPCTPLANSPPLQSPPPHSGDRHFHVFLVNMYCAGLCCPSGLPMALHCFPITTNQAPVCLL